MLYYILILEVKNMNTISKLLYEYRKNTKMTQQDLVLALSQRSNEFQALNTVTVSRWETGTTSPSLSKKKSIMHFLAQENAFLIPVCHNILKERYANLYEPLSSVFTLNYKHLIGNLPEHRIGEPTFFHLHDFKSKDEHIEHIIDIEVATNVSNYYSVSPKLLTQWCAHPSTFAIVGERKKQHLGHMILLKLKNSVAEEIARHERSEFDIKESDFCALHEKGTYYVHALYGRSPKIAAMLNVKAYLHLFEHMQSTDNVIIFSSRTDGVLLSKDYGIKVIAHGEDEEYGFDWYGMMSPVEDILFSNTVLKLAF